MKVSVTKENVVITECSRINEGEYRVNKCEFRLPEYFNGLTVTAAFDNIPVPLFGNECYIPSLKKGTSTLGVYAYEETEEGLRLMYSPKPAMFYVDSGSYSDSVGKEEIPETSVFEKYCKEISENAVPKSCIVRSFDVEADVSDDQIYSAGAVMELAEVIGEEFQNDRNEINGIKKGYDSFICQVNEKISASEEKIYGLGNSLKGNKSQNGILTLTDISPVEHNINVSLSRDDILGFSDESVVVHGKNLFGFEGRVLRDFTASEDTNLRSFSGDGIYVGVSGSNYSSSGKVEYTYDPVSEEITLKCRNAWYGVGIDIFVKPGEIYSVSMQTELQSARMVTAFYTAEGEYLSFSQVTGGSISVPDKAYRMLCILTSSQVSDNVKFKNVQIEKGQKPTAFCKYYHPVRFDAGVDGKITGIESIYPVTVIESDNPDISITADYNRDINVAFNELKTAILSLGGAI